MEATISANGAGAFDAVAANYEAALQRGLTLSGEGPEYFAERRIAWTQRVLTGQSVRRVLDFGCGVGLAAPRLAAAFAAEVWGFDPSAQSVEPARRDHNDSQLRFTDNADELPAGGFELVYCNGVFHHIPSAERAAAPADVRRALCVGGWFALWENNPWNLGTQWVMSRIPFDRDAEKISPLAGRRMVRAAGFHVCRSDAWFLFPHALRWLRPFESLVHRLPLGGQYLLLAQKVAE